MFEAASRPHRENLARSGWRRARRMVAMAALLASPAAAATAPPSVCAERATAPAKLVEAVRAGGERFEVARLLGAVHEAAPKARRLDADPELARASVVQRPNARAVARVLRTRPRSLLLPVQLADREVELELVRVDVTTPDFAVVTSDGDRAVPYEPGVHYRGIVRGDPESLAAVSVFRDEVMGSFSTPADGTVVIGRLQGQRAAKLADLEHVAYRAAVIEKHQDWTCDTPDHGADLDALLSPTGGTGDKGETTAVVDEAAAVAKTTAAKCVRVYVETDYDVYQNKGSAAAVANFVTGFFNQVAVLYAKESVPVSLSQVYVWTSADPYTGTTPSTMLSQFRSYRNSFNGDIGHLVSFHAAGGISPVNGLCAASTDWRQSYSGMGPTFLSVPTYSWTVQVFTHEMGHVLGSQHTHACAWNGNGTAIDGCYTPQGSCPRPGYPSGGGTIMSYCHLVYGVGINFNNGFGPQPGNVIRSRVATASCLTSCDATGTGDTGGGGTGGDTGGGTSSTCSGGTSFTGSLSGTGDSVYLPASGYTTTTSGAQSGTLTFAGPADFDLYLAKWNGKAWSTVSSRKGTGLTKTLSYSGPAGSYRWQVMSGSGSGTYSFCAKHPL